MLWFGGSWFGGGPLKQGGLVLNALDLLLESNIYICCLWKKAWRRQWPPVSEHRCLDSPRCAPTAPTPGMHGPKDERLQGGSSAWYPKVPSPSTELAYVEALMGWDGVSSCVVGDVCVYGLLSAFAGSNLTAPVASAPAFCVLVLMVYPAKQQPATPAPRRWC